MLAILSANIQGLCPSRGKYKLKMLEEMTTDEGLGILAITESHLNPDYHEGEIAIENFIHFRADRSVGTKKGGVIIYIRNFLSPGANLLTSGSHGIIEYAVLAIPSASMSLVCVYRPPTAELSDFVHVLSEIKRSLAQLPSQNSLILCGDLNFPNIKWPTTVIQGGSLMLRQQAQALLDFFGEFFLQQLIEEPTRENNILDLFATDDDQLVLRYEVRTKSNISDHNLVKITTTQYNAPDLQPDPKRKTLFTLNFWKDNIDWSVIREMFASKDWESLLSNEDPDEIYHQLLAVIEEVCLEKIPKKQEWKKRGIPRDRKLLMRKRSKLNKKLNQMPTELQKSQIVSELHVIDNKIVASHRAELTNNEREAVEKIKNDRKFFYKYAKSKSIVKAPVGPLKIGDELITEPAKISEILKQQFESVYSVPQNSTNIEALAEEPGPRCMTDLHFGQEHIANAIKNIPSHSSPGPDGIPAKLLRECVEELKKPIFLLWRASMDSGKVPRKLKLSHVIPIFKKGDKSSPKNYRPISLVSHISKIFERVVVKNLTDYLNDLDLFNKQQHGFRSGRSCLSQLLEHHQTILAHLESGTGVDVVYLDFAKAFDKVDYGVLLSKLKSIGVCDLLLRWLNSFLTNRKQMICIDGSLSSEGPVISGVPQGSSLGPLLFLILIADIDADTKYASVSSFADDTRLLMPIGTTEDNGMMQMDLDKVYSWATENNMRFNTEKFELLRYNPSDILMDSYFTPEGIAIPEVGRVRDLGVQIENTGAFQCQLAESIKRSNNMASWVLRVFKTREERLMMTLYQSMIIPHLEYCCQLWSPYLLRDIRSLEAVQRSYTARVAGLGHLSYWERLAHLKLYSLERRRERYIILYVYKILLNIVPNMQEERFALKPYFSVRGDRLCRVPAISNASTARIRNMVEHSFAIQGPKLFNCLPAKLRNFQGSFLTFKGKLDKFLNQVCDKPCTPGYHQPATSNTLIAQLAQMRADGTFL